MNKRNIRLLRDGLTIGYESYRIGQVVPSQEAPKELHALADGQVFLGHRWAEWVKETAVDKEPVPTPVPEPAPAPNPLPELPPNLTGVDLDDMIKDLVRGGMGKSAIVKELGKLETITHREASDKFDEMLAIGVLVAGEISGKYTVVE